MHCLLNNRKGSLSSTYKKNSEANNKVYDLIQRTVAALDHLAEAYETFEDTCGMLFASEEDAADTLDAAQRQQDDALEALEECRKNMDSAYREFSNYRALHEAACFDVKETGRRHSELERKAEETHTRTFLQREEFVEPQVTTWKLRGTQQRCGVSGHSRQSDGQRNSRTYVWRP